MNPSNVDKISCGLNQVRRLLIDSRRSAGTPMILDNGFTKFSPRLSWNLSKVDSQEGYNGYSTSLNKVYVHKFKNLIEFFLKQNIKVAIATPPLYSTKMEGIISQIGMHPNSVYKKMGLKIRE